MRSSWCSACGMDDIPISWQDIMQALFTGSLQDETKFEKEPKIFPGDVYETRVLVENHPVTGRPFILFLTGNSWEESLYNRIVIPISIQIIVSDSSCWPQPDLIFILHKNIIFFYSNWCTIFNLERYIEYYNEHRPHQALWNYTSGHVHRLGSNTILFDHYSVMVH